MCGRYSITTPPEAMARLFGTAGPMPNFPPRYNAAPTQIMPVVRFNPETRARSLDLLRWGLVPHWSKDAAIGARLINARAETLAEKPSFRDAFRKRRCLVPADGFYEWRKDTKPKQPWLIRLAGGGPFAFAGLWDNWRGPDGAWLRTFTIATSSANPLLAPLHDRMPVILDPADHAAWLGETAAAPEALLDLLRPFPAERMEAFPVGRAVNDVRNDDPSLIVPA